MFVYEIRKSPLIKGDTGGCKYTDEGLLSS